MARDWYDLFILDARTGALRRLTHDAFAELHDLADAVAAGDHRQRQLDARHAAPHPQIEVVERDRDDLDEHFALACHSRSLYEELSMLSPRDRLCFAILDYQSAPKRDSLCFCPVEFDVITVRGDIHGRPIDEQFTYCLCGDGRRASDDARVILKTHPPFRIGLGGA